MRVIICIFTVAITGFSAQDLTWPFICPIITLQALRDAWDVFCRRLAELWYQGKASPGPVMVQADPATSMGVHVEGPNEHSPEDAVVLNTLSYAYSGHRPIVSNISLTLPKGSRCLLLGANGAGQPL